MEVSGGKSAVRMYDTFSTDYDRFVNWEGRLAAEMPFILQQLRAVNAHRVLDVACGTGMHAIALAERGFEVVGTDASRGMIEESRANAATAGVSARFEVAGFGELAQSLATGDRGLPFDALLCLGNSLPHVLTPTELQATLDDFVACLAPGGLVLIQNRNFDAVLAERDRWMAPQSHREGPSEWLFVRFYDFRPDGLLSFNVVTLRRREGEAWRQQVTSTRLWPLTHRELTEALGAAGLASMTRYGDMEGAPFDAGDSPNLIATARAADRAGEPRLEAGEEDE
jgi:SAM-dependent methyltransferase